MTSHRLTLTALLVMMACNAFAGHEDRIAPGKVIPEVRSLADSTQRYALYLPSAYDSNESWPVIYAFDPAGRGALAVELFAPAAERFGYIVAGSNTSENGPWEPILAAADAMFRDTQQRFAIDGNRIYTAGFSGGARAATSLAVLYKFIKGVIGCGAGFSSNYPPHFDLEFHYYGIVGVLDHSYQEMKDLDLRLEKYNIQHFIKEYYGSHEWPPSEELEMAVLWIEFRAMENSLEYLDYGEIYDFYSRHLEIAHQLESDKLYYDACLEYSGILSFLAGLKNSGEVRDRVNEIKRMPEYTAEIVKRIRIREKEGKKLAEFIQSFNSYELNFGNSAAKLIPWSYWEAQVKAAGDMTLVVNNPLEALLGHRLIDFIWRTAYMKYDDILGTEYEPLAPAYLKIWQIAKPEAAAPYFLMASYYTKVGKQKKAQSALLEGMKRNDISLAPPR